MVDMEVAVIRPQRWDAPFGDAMDDGDVDRLLAVEPFRAIDPELFPPSLPLRDILKNDARLVRYSPGDIIVREGDYGSSAFFILRGRVRVVLSGLSSETLGRQAPKRRGWFSTLWKVLWQPRFPEVRKSFAASEKETGVRGQATHARVFLQDVPRVLEEYETVSLEAGEIFGELAAITRSPRSATVVAEHDSVLVEIRWQGLRDLMRRTDALRLHIERLYRENSLRVHLRETPLLAELSPAQLDAVAGATTFESHGEYDWHAAYETAVRRRAGDAIVDEPLIAEEGLPADGLILVRSGFARQSRRYGAGHRTAAYLGRGQVFGLAEAIGAFHAQQAATWDWSLRALGYVDVLRIPQLVLEQLVFPHVKLATVARLLEEAPTPATVPGWMTSNKASAPQARAATAPVDQRLLEFVVDRRLMNGQQAMVIDLDRCTRCDDCVRACAATHDNNPRFVRQGPRHDNLMFAQACMHCIDPVCMIGCPTGAIHRDAATGVVRINDRTCIGCGTCAQSCPYDSIQMVEIRDRRGAVVIDEASRQPIAKATKCDLCTDLPGGPACQRACPHDALVRLDLGELGELSAWTGR